MERLHHEHLLSATVQPWHAGLHAWQIDIDGNVNSWGLLWKLLTVSCILRVQSQRCQWYHKHLQPWCTLVPVNADLSDLGERLEWCNKHRQECAGIAAAGRSLAEHVVQEIEDDLLSAGCATHKHGCNQLLDGSRLDESGSELLDPDPWLAKRLLSRGLQLDPSEAIAWFNLGIGLHQQRRIAAAVRAYRHCLALPHNKKLSKQRATTLRRICSYSAAGTRGGITTPSVLGANQETIHCLHAPSDLATKALSNQSNQFC